MSKKYKNRKSTEYVLPNIYRYWNTKGEPMYLVKYTRKGNNIYKRGFIELSAAIKYLDDIKKGLVGQKVDIGRYEQKIRIYTLYEVMDIYLDKMKKSDNRYGTYDKALYIINKIIKPNFDDIPLPLISSEDCEEFRDKLRNLKYQKIVKGKASNYNYSTTSKNQFLNWFRIILKFAKKYGLDGYPTDDLKPFKETKEERDKKIDKHKNIWTYEEFYLFLNELGCIEGLNSPYYGIYLCLANLGLRKEECGALRWDDVDFKEKEITIDEGLTKKTESGLWETCLVKREASNRRVPVCDGVLDYLRMRYEKDSKSIGFNKKWFIFHANGNGEKFVNPNHVDDHKERILKRIGLRWNTNHQLRHMYINKLRYSGVPEFDIQKVVGHETSFGTTDIYMHISKAGADKIREVMQELLQNCCKFNSKQ